MRLIYPTFMARFTIENRAIREGHRKPSHTRGEIPPFGSTPIAHYRIEPQGLHGIYLGALSL